MHLLHVQGVPHVGLNIPHAQGAPYMGLTWECIHAHEQHNGNVNVIKISKDTVTVNEEEYTLLHMICALVMRVMRMYQCCRERKGYYEGWETICGDVHLAWG